MINKFNRNKKSVILIYKNNNMYDKSNIKLNTEKNIQYDKDKNFKGNFIDYGFFLLNKNDIIKNIPNRIKFDFSYLLKVLIKKKLIQYIIVKKRFYEIGKIDGLREFEKYIKEKLYNFKNFKQIINLIKSKNYKFARFDKKNSSKRVYLRHDIDFDPKYLSRFLNFYNKEKNCLKYIFFNKCKNL